jgi:DNA-binding transcriptional regulator YhcF (GntR family)
VADLGLAKGTVAKAYELLELSAVVESKGHKGTFVRDVGAACDSGQPTRRRRCPG